MKALWIEEKNSEAGMTLVEVIAVIVLIALLYVVVGRNVFGNSDAAKAKLNIVKMNNLKNYLGQYKLEYNTYPAKLDDLIHGAAKAGSVFTPLAQDDDLKDVWENPYIYIPEGGGKGYSLKSLGADGLEGGEGAKSDVVVKP